MPINNSIINQKGTPAFFSDIFANRPAFGYAGRVFISTDTGAIYEDTGSAWTLIADAGAGTTGTLQQVTTNGNTTTLGIVIDGININNGAGTGLNNIVIGGGLQSNTTGTQNTAIGIDSLVINTTGSNNTALGGETLNNNTTGVNNVAIGYGTLQANTTGFSNTAIGKGSLGANTTGIYNTAIGLNSLVTNTVGGSNTAIGQGSLEKNTTASYNTAIGNTSLNNNTTGAQNTAIGYNSLASNTTGLYNTAIGYISLLNNTTANYNTAIGNSSLQANTTGANNTSIGYGTGIAITTGSANTIIGTNSLPNVTTGQQNTIIGASSGGGITTGSNNTIIGVGVNSLSTTLANNIILADGSGNVRLFSDANGLIGINQAVGSTIGGQLDIHSTQTYALVLNGLSTSNAYTAFSNASVGKWRIGNTYNAGANTFDIYNLGTSSSALNINITTNNIGIGTTTQTSSANYTSLVINGTTGSEIYLRGANVDYGYMYANSSGVVLATQTSIPLTFQTNATSRMRIVGSNGNVLIGSTTDDTTNKLQVNGSVKISTASTSGFICDSTNNASFHGFVIQNNGTAVAGMETNANNGEIKIGGYQTTNDFFPVIYSDGVAAMTFGVGGSITITIANLAGTGSRAVLADANGLLSAPVSDISVKENINTIGYGLNEILKMNPVWFNYNNEYKNYGEGRQNGNIAQEMETIIPEAVFTTPSTGKMGINYDQLHAVYIKAIQELNEKVNRLYVNHYGQ